MITCAGYNAKHKQYLIEESEPNLRLNFKGADAEKFRQSNPPTGKAKTVDFSLTVEFLMAEFPGFLPVIP